jgi:hypothetical protein
MIRFGGAGGLSLSGGGTHEYAMWDAAYVVGSLSSVERREYEAHLSTCPSCREAVSELSGLPALLAQLDRDDVDSIDERGRRAGDRRVRRGPIQSGGTGYGAAGPRVRTDDDAGETDPTELRGQPPRPRPTTTGTRPATRWRWWRWGATAATPSWRPGWYSPKRPCRRASAPRC